MKKRIAFLLLSLVFVLPLVIGSFAHVDNASFGPVNNYTGTVVEDGYKDQAYLDYGKHFVADAYEFVRGEPKPGYSANFWWLFTDDYKELHIFCEIIDPTVLIPTDFSHQNIEMCHHTDCVEIFIDPTNEVCGTWRDDDLISAKAYNYRIDTSGYISGTLWGAKLMGAAACAPFFSASVAMTDGGYNFEFTIHCDVFEYSGLTTLQRGEDWGVQMLAKNVYDEIQYQYENLEGNHRWDDSIYSMNSFTVECSMSPGVADYHTMDFDYILLGNTVSDEEEPDADDTDPVLPDETNADPDDTTAEPVPGEEDDTDPANPGEDDTTAADDPTEGTTKEGDKPDDPKNTGDNGNTGKKDDPNGNKENNGGKVRPAGDGFAVAVAILLCSSAAAIAIVGKKRH